MRYLKYYESTINFNDKLIFALEEIYNTTTNNQHAGWSSELLRAFRSGKDFPYNDIAYFEMEWDPVSDEKDEIKRIKSKFRGDGQSQALQVIKPTKALKKILTSLYIFNEFPEPSFTDFVKLIGRTIHQIDLKPDTTPRKIERVWGSDIVKYYQDDFFYRDGKLFDQLTGSCMTGKPASYFDIYVKNPEVCSLLVVSYEDRKKPLFSSDIVKKFRNFIGKEDYWGKVSLPLETKHITTRALLWKLDGGGYLIDRVYSGTREFKDQVLINKWLRENLPGEKIYHKRSLSKLDNLKVTLKISEFSKYPYMDTLSFLHQKKIVGTGKRSSEGGFLSNRCGANIYKSDQWLISVLNEIDGKRVFVEKNTGFQDYCNHSLYSHNI